MTKDMLEDYLRAVSRLLPRAKRDDIVAELRDEILTRMEVKEEELGRPLSADETEQVLRDFGHPIVVAARYRDGQQYVVGPALYPFWMFGVRLAVLLELCFSVLVFIGRVVGGGDVAQAFGAAIGSGLTGAMTLIGFATVAAWLIERNAIRIDYFTTWRVRDLRFLDLPIWDWSDLGDWLAGRTATPERDPMSAHASSSAQFGSFGRHYGWSHQQSAASRGVATIVMGIVFILWWIGVISFGLSALPFDYSAVHVDPGALGATDLAALKAAVYWPVMAYFATIILYGVAILAFPRGVRMRGAIDIVIGATVLAVVSWVWFWSPIAPFVSVASVAELVERVLALAADPFPLPLPTLVTVFLVFVALGGVFRVLGGIWEVLIGAPRYASDG